MPLLQSEHWVWLRTKIISSWWTRMASWCEQGGVCAYCSWSPKEGAWSHTFISGFWPWVRVPIHQDVSGTPWDVSVWWAIRLGSETSRWWPQFRDGWGLIFFLRKIWRSCGPIPWWIRTKLSPNKWYFDVPVMYLFLISQQPSTSAVCISVRKRLLSLLVTAGICMDAWTSLSAGLWVPVAVQCPALAFTWSACVILEREGIAKCVWIILSNLDLERHIRWR